MPKKNFHFYLEKAQGKENFIIEKINEILKFKQEIKESNIIKETFTFLHYSEESEFNPEIYTNDESAMSSNYVSNLDELKKIINEKNLYSDNNSITYNIEYLENESVVKKSYSTEEHIRKDDNELEIEKKESSFLKIEK